VNQFERDKQDRPALNLNLHSGVKSMQRFILSALVFAAVAVLHTPVEAQSRRNGTLPKADWSLGQITVVRGDVLVRVTNAGFTTAPQTTVHLIVTDLQTGRQIHQATKRQPSLRPNITVGQLFQNLPKLENVIVSVAIDPQNQFAEANEKNNFSSKKFVRLGPDIEASKIVFHSDRQLSVTIRNNGPQNLPGPIDVTLTAQFGQFNGQQIRQNIRRLDAGKHRIMLFNLQTPLQPGTTVVIQGDSGLRIKEEKEGNNQAVKVYSPSNKR